MFKTLLLAFFILMSGHAMATAQTGKGRTASCLLVVRGHEIMRGECTFTPFDGDGSFMISSYNGKYFARVSIMGKGIAEGHWNEDAYAPRAYTPLGTLYREDGCWVNNYASVCAY